MKLIVKTHMYIAIDRMLVYQRDQIMMFEHALDPSIRRSTRKLLDFNQIVITSTDVNVDNMQTYPIKNLLLGQTVDVIAQTLFRL